MWFIESIKRKTHQIGIVCLDVYSFSDIYSVNICNFTELIPNAKTV